MRYVQACAFLLGAAMYVAVIAFAGQLGTMENLQWNFVIVGAWNLLLLIVTVIVIVDTIVKVRAKKTRGLATDVLVVKLASIPFFVLNYVVLAFLFAGGAMIFLFGGFVLWVVVAIGSGLTYVAMLSTSIYAWAAIAQMRREAIIGTRLAVLYTILSLVFVTDIATGIVLFGHSRRRPRLALIVVLLITGLALLVLGLPGIVNIEIYFEDGFDPIGLAMIGILIAGIALILATVIVSVRRRSVLQTEAQQAALARAAATESDTSDRAIAG